MLVALTQRELLLKLPHGLINLDPQRCKHPLGLVNSRFLFLFLKKKAKLVEQIPTEFMLAFIVTNHLLNHKIVIVIRVWPK